MFRPKYTSPHLQLHVNHLFCILHAGLLNCSPVYSIFRKCTKSAMVESVLLKEDRSESVNQPASSLPKPNHQDDVDDEDENVKQLGDCSSVYLALQDCLVETNRNWKACQPKVQALKACNQRRMSSQEK